MKHLRLFSAVILAATCLGPTTSCSQINTSGQQSVLNVFEATTPCDDVPGTMLKITTNDKCEMIKWKLTLYQDPNTYAPSVYTLVCRYGLPKQGTRDFLEGFKTIEMKGNWIIDKNTLQKPGVVYKLTAENTPINLSFLKLDTNMLHLLDSNNRLMNGNQAWSYTLNRTNPITPTSVKPSTLLYRLKPGSSDTTTVEEYGGRMPCNNYFLDLHKISASGCNLIKCQLILYRDPQTHQSTTFQLNTIYVGKGDTRYTTTGSWLEKRGIKNDPEALVYLLQPDKNKPQLTLSFLKADNVLFFMDSSENLMVGDIYSSYTLNKIAK